MGDRNMIISSMKQRVAKSFIRRTEISDPFVNGTSNVNNKSSDKMEKQNHTFGGQSSSPFPLSNILTRRLSSMSNFSSTSSSFDETSSDENGIADNEEDSGEAFKGKYKSSLQRVSKKRKSRGLNKKVTKTKSRYKDSLSSTRKKNKLSSSYSNSKDHQKNFKSIQKGVENILNSDALFEEDQEKNDFNKTAQNDLEEDDDSNDNFRHDSGTETKTNGTCNKKKAKALINCFRSFAMKPK